MAVKVVGHEDRLIKHATCRHCSAILQYLPCDVKHSTTTDYTGGTKDVYYLTCPECGKLVYVKNPSRA